MTKRPKALRQGFLVGPWGFIPVHSRSRTKVTIVNAEDYATHSVHNWTEDRGYAARWEVRDGRRRKVYLHREVNHTPPRLSTDHVNGDRLDNRRRNLRAVLPSKNNSNRSRARNNTSGVTGVYSTKRRRYRAEITFAGNRVCLGTFATLGEAARMRRFAEWLLPAHHPRHWLHRNTHERRRVSRAA